MEKKCNLIKFFLPFLLLHLNSLWFVTRGQWSRTIDKFPLINWLLIPRGGRWFMCACRCPASRLCLFSGRCLSCWCLKADERHVFRGKKRRSSAHTLQSSFHYTEETSAFHFLFITRNMRDYQQWNLTCCLLFLLAERNWLWKSDWQRHESRYLSHHS